MRAGYATRKIKFTWPYSYFTQGSLKLPCFTKTKFGTKSKEVQCYAE